MSSPRRVVVVEPWLGGSHQVFWEGWKARSRHPVEIEGLAGRHFKWRMHAGAWELARRLGKHTPPEVLVVSDYLDLPGFLGFLPAAWRQAVTLCYFHENQLTYPLAPGADENERDLHFGLMNILSAVCADGLAFNSGFHLRDFENAALELLERLPRPTPRGELLRGLEVARVIAPGIDVDAIPIGPGAEPEAPLRVLYNQRWEHDKDPATFLRAVHQAQARGAKIELILCGESFSEIPEEVAAELRRHEDAILHRGLIRSRSEYAAQLARCDLVVSTARHEFFGMAVVEAMSAGVTPLLPCRQSYPEVVGAELSDEAIYQGEPQLVRRLLEHARDPSPLRTRETRARWRARAEHWSIERTARALDDFCEELAALRASMPG